MGPVDVTSPFKALAVIALLVGMALGVGAHACSGRYEVSVHRRAP